jgi:hypothetical protein
MNIQESYSKEEFNKLVDKKLGNDEFRQYQSLFKNNYVRHRGTDEHILKENVSDDAKKQIDFVLKRIGNRDFSSLSEIAEYFRMLLAVKKTIVVFAYNGTGKTRLSSEFKSLGQELDEETGIKTADTLYYNAFTEDLFHWENDLEHDSERVLTMNSNSRFFSGLQGLAIDIKIRELLSRYADFDFFIDFTTSKISFSRNIMVEGTLQSVPNIKISRGEENIFIWCFFLAIVDLVVQSNVDYLWVKYIYIDDPISSLDDNNVISIAAHLSELLKKSKVKAVVSTHHTLFFNVFCNEINKAEQLFLQKNNVNNQYLLKDTTKTPFFHHVALLKELKRVVDLGEIYTYHFNILRTILEKTASFHGYAHFSSCIRKNPDDADDIIHKRMLDIMSHGNYSLLEPVIMGDENKGHFKNILYNFLEDYKFNNKIIDSVQVQEDTQ